MENSFYWTFYLSESDSSMGINTTSYKHFMANPLRLGYYIIPHKMSKMSVKNMYPKGIQDKKECKVSKFEEMRSGLTTSGVLIKVFAIKEHNWNTS